MTDEEMQLCEFHYRGMCTMGHEPEVEKYSKGGVVFAEIVVNAGPCNRQFCPFQRNRKKKPDTESMSIFELD